MNKLLKSEIILHEKERNKIRDFRSFGIDPFMVSNIPETEMSYVISQIPDRHFAKKREMKRLFQVESIYRRLGCDQDIDKQPNMPKQGLSTQQVLPFNFNNMKTILVIYTNNRLDNPGYKQRYAFNTEAELVEGDMIKSENYSTNMQVVAVLDRSYKYFNKNTGDLKDVHDNSNLFEIKTLKLVDQADNVVIATKIKK